MLKKLKVIADDFNKKQKNSDNEEVLLMMLGKLETELVKIVNEQTVPLTPKTNATTVIPRSARPKTNSQK